jgi:hypothetical protein
VPSGKQPLLDNRVHWARTYLDKAGARKRTRRSHFVVTDRGKELLKQHPDRIDGQVLRQFPKFVAFSRKHTKVDSDNGQEVVQSEDQGAPELLSATPEDMLQTAEAAIAERLRAQLLERIQELSPAFFERLVVDLIVAMGMAAAHEITSFKGSARVAIRGSMVSSTKTLSALMLCTCRQRDTRRTTRWGPPTCYWSGWSRWSSRKGARPGRHHAGMVGNIISELAPGAGWSIWSRYSPQRERSPAVRPIHGRA